MAAEIAQIRPDRSLAGSHLPGRTMSGQRILLIGHDCGIVHAGEEIV